MNVFFSYYNRAVPPGHLLLQSYQLAMHLAKEQYGNATLVVHPDQAHYFKGLPQTRTITAFTDLPPYPLNTLSKIKTIQIAAQEGAPFMHVDGDAYLFKQLPAKVQNAPIFAESYDDFILFKYDLLNARWKLGHPDFIADPKITHKGIRTGVVGGHNTKFFLDFADATLKLILAPENKPYLGRLTPVYKWDKYYKNKVSTKHYGPSHLIDRYALWRFYMNYQPAQELALIFPGRCVDQDYAAEIGYAHVGGITRLKKFDRALRRARRKRGLQAIDYYTQMQKEPTLPPEGMGHYVAGAMKIAKATFMPETQLAQTRLEVCKTCDQWTGKRCRICGCFTKLKVRIPEEKCPMGKW